MFSRLPTMDLASCFAEGPRLGNKLFLLHYRAPDAQNEFPAAVRIKLCPWCGAKLENFPAYYTIASAVARRRAGDASTTPAWVTEITSRER
jgi:hypothetical protein